MAIAYQPVTTRDPISTRPARPRTRYRSVAIYRPSRASTTVRLFGLLVATAMSVALATAIVAGTALFALLNYAG